MKPMTATLSSVRSRSSIYIPLALLAAVIAVAGFWKSYFGGRFMQSEMLIHLHAAVFMGWIFLVGLQSYFAITGRIALHMKIGRFGMAYGVFLVVVGLGFALVMFARRVAAVGPENTHGGFLAPLTDMLVFTTFLIGAWVTRRRPEFHRRFILLATNTILIAAVGRASGGTGSLALRDVLPFLLIWLSPLWIAMAYDWFKHRTFHRVYAFGAMLLIALRYRGIVRETGAWQAVSRWIAERLV